MGELVPLYLYLYPWSRFIGQPAYEYLAMSFLPLQTNETSDDIGIVATSRPRGGLSYGTHTASFHTSKIYAGYASHQACVLARCPTFAMETEVDLQIAYGKLSQCSIG